MTTLDFELEIGSGPIPANVTIQLITFYEQGCAPAETQDWAQAVAKFTMVAEAAITLPMQCRGSVSGQVQVRRVTVR